MPWHIENDNPACDGWAVVKDSDGEVEGCHDSEADAKKQLAALYANEERTMTLTAPEHAAPPKENLVRAAYPGVELKRADDGSMPTLVGHVAPWEQWAEIDSLFEGHFLERFRRGSFARTISHQAARIKALFQHGMDPQIGDKPLGPFEYLGEDEVGIRYEVPLLDTAYNRELLPGLEAGLYGSSHRFSVIQEEWEWEPEKAPHNPDGIPERTVSEARLYELGPVTFPAYEGAGAGVRSLTDAVVLAPFLRDPGRLHQMLRSLGDPLPPGPEPDAHPEGETREPVEQPRRFRTREEYLEWIQSI